MKDLNKLTDNAYKSFGKHESECNKLLTELKKCFKGFPKEFENQLGCFMQAGDGITLNDNEDRNFHLGEIIRIIQEKGFITYEEFKRTSF